MNTRCQTPELVSRYLLSSRADTERQAPFQMIRLRVPNPRHRSRRLNPSTAVGPVFTAFDHVISPAYDKKVPETSRGNPRINATSSKYHPRSFVSPSFSLAGQPPPLLSTPFVLQHFCCDGNIPPSIFGHKVLTPPGNYSFLINNFHEGSPELTQINLEPAAASAN